MISHARSLSLVLLVLATAAPAAQDGEEAAAAEVAATSEVTAAAATAEVEVNCERGELLAGQFLCEELLVDEETQQPRDCEPETGTAPNAARCVAAPGFVCRETGNW